MSHLKPEELEEARDGAREGAKAVWDFLSSFNYH